MDAMLSLQIHDTAGRNGDAGQSPAAGDSGRHVEHQFVRVSPGESLEVSEEDSEMSSPAVYDEHDSDEDDSDEHDSDEDDSDEHDSDEDDSDGHDSDEDDSDEHDSDERSDF